MTWIKNISVEFFIPNKMVSVLESNRVYYATSTAYEWVGKMLQQQYYQCQHQQLVETRSLQEIS